MAATAAPAVASTVGLKNMVIAPVTKDDDSGTTYGELQKVAGAIEASITPENNDPDIQYYDDIEGDVLYPDPELAFKQGSAVCAGLFNELVLPCKIKSCQRFVHQQHTAFLHPCPGQRRQPRFAAAYPGKQPVLQLYHTYALKIIFRHSIIILPWRRKP